MQQMFAMVLFGAHSCCEPNVSLAALFPAKIAQNTTKPLAKPRAVAGSLGDTKEIFHGVFVHLNAPNTASSVKTAHQHPSSSDCPSFTLATSKAKNSTDDLYRFIFEFFSCFNHPQQLLNPMNASVCVFSPPTPAVLKFPTDLA
jgi:hypothetical protein